MKFEFEEKEIDYIYNVLRSTPLKYNDVDPIIHKIIDQFNVNRAGIEAPVSEVPAVSVDDSGVQK